MGVRRPQLDAFVAELFEPREDRGQVPILGDVVGDDPELRHGATPCGWSSHIIAFEQLLTCCRLPAVTYRAADRGSTPQTVEPSRLNGHYLTAMDAQSLDIGWR